MSDSELRDRVIGSTVAVGGLVILTISTALLSTLIITIMIRKAKKHEDPDDSSAIDEGGDTLNMEDQDNGTHDSFTSVTTSTDGPCPTIIQVHKTTRKHALLIWEMIC